MIVVLDTNVWISVLRWQKLTDLIASCEEIEQEIFRALTEKFSWDRHRARFALALGRRYLKVEFRTKRIRKRSPRVFLGFHLPALGAPSTFARSDPRRTATLPRLGR